MFKGQSYTGASFYEFLKADAPGLIPDFGNMDWTTVELPHGTTVLSLTYDGGVLMAGDRLATAGHEVATRDMDKVFRIDHTCMMAIAGAAGPAIEMVKMFQLELEHFEKLDGQELTFEGKANRLSFLLRQNLPAAMQGLAVMPLYAGYDHDSDKGRIYKFDITGGRYRETDFYATGSGGKDARSSLKRAWHSNLSREQATEIAIEALMEAADEDTATGGFDISRGIYPIAKFANKEGAVDVPEAEVLAARERILARREAA